MNIRSVKKKIKSVVNVRKITRAMQLVSAVKMKKAQQMAIEGRAFQEELERIIHKVTDKIDPSLSGLTASSSQAKRDLVILLSSNKGLCGSFNFNLFQFFYKNIDFKNIDFVTIGKKGTSLIHKYGGNIIADFSSNNPLDSASAIFNLVLDNFLANKYKSVSIFYNKFISTLSNEPVKAVLLPLQLENKTESSKESGYVIEPDAGKVVDPILQTFVEQKIRYAIIESEASEHSARMIAMKNATDNADDVAYNLVLMANKLRQEKITGELLDMITAKESVEQLN